MKDHLESSIFGDHDEHGDDTVHDGEHRGGADLPDGTDEHLEAPASTRRGRKAQDQAQRVAARRGSSGSGRMRGWRRFLVILLALVVVGGGAFAAYTVLRPVVAGFMESNDYPGPGEGAVRLSVEQGAGGATIARELVDQDVVKSSKAFIEAVNAEPRSAGIQPGIYGMRKQMKASEALALLIDPANRITTQVTIPEGLWASEIYARLSRATGLPVGDYQKAAKDAAALGLPAAAKGNIEGYLFPASYDFEPDISAAAQLKLLVAQSTKRLDALGVKPADMERTMTIASLVESEARLPVDRPKVARVIENRVAKGQRLELDSTVNYASGKRAVTTTDTERASKSPYNTYQVTGLPPGPISNPGESAIEAATHPAAGPWLFFVTVNPATGETKFAVTYEDHLKNVAQFQQWCQANKGKC